MEQFSKFNKLLIGTLSLLVILNSSLTFANADAITAFEENNLKDAKLLFNKSLDENATDISALQYLARIALRESEFDDAEEYIEKAQDLAPKDAEVQFIVARIMGRQAQEASIFSAPGYAKKSLQAFKKATELEPSNVQYRNGLLSFYLMAPGIVGGDEELAMVQADAIAKLDAEQGFLAKARVYRETDERKLLETYNSAIKQFPSSVAIIFRRGMYYQSKEKFELAVVDFQQIQSFETVDDNEFIKFSALYQIGRSSVLADKNLEQGINALQNYINASPKVDGLPSLAWAKYRLGLLLASKGEKAQAQLLYRQAKLETDDKSLIKQLKRKIKKKRR